jgi:hypothetical protein
VRVSEPNGKPQKLVKVGPKERKALLLTTSTNQRVAENWQRELRRRKGPAACLWCGAEPCGVLWTRPGDPVPKGERCCVHCSHEPVDGWQHTHTAWAGGQAFPVCALTMREGEVVYLRRDGVVQFLEMRAPKPGAAMGQDEETDVPTVAFLGVETATGSLYVAGEGGDRGVNLWANQRELDPLWLPLRMQSAVARDEERRRRRASERKAREDAHDRKIDAMIAREQAEREASIAKRQLQHETRIVLDELDLDAAIEGEVASLSGSPAAEVETAAPATDAGTEGADLPRLVRHICGEGPDRFETLCGRSAADVRTFEGVEAAVAAEAPDCCKHCGRCARPELYSPPEEPPRRLTAEERKRPAVARATGGRLKRSARQRQARERQKRAWARQEARNRLEVKRLQRQARAREDGAGGDVVGKDE